MKTSHLILLLVLNCVWASLPTAVTVLGDRIGTLELVFVRYVFAFLSLVVLWPWLPGSLPRGADFWRTCAMGVAVFTVGHLFQVGGMQMSQASDASIVLGLDPLVSSLGAALFLHERIPRRRWAGFGLAIAGVALMSLWHRVTPMAGLLANLFIVLSFVAEAVWSVMGKPLITRWGIPKVTTLALGAATVVNGGLLLLDPAAHAASFARMSAGTWVAAAAMGIVLTAVGYNVWYLVIREAPVSLAAMTIYLQPIVGTALAITLTGEHLHAGHLWGCLIIGAGLLVGLRAGGPSGAPPATSRSKSSFAHADPDSS